MGLFSKFFKPPQTETKSSIGLAQMMVMGRDHSYSMVDWRTYAKEGYQNNPTVFACINLLATAFARIPFKAVDADGSPVPDSPLQALLDKPNIDTGGVEFRTDCASWLLLTGNSFIERLVDGVTITELYTWQPYDMTIGRAKGSRIPSKYIWRKNQDGQMVWEVDPMTGQADLCHWKTFNPDPYDSSFGLSPLASAASSVDSYNSAMKLRYNRMKNGLSIDGILSPSGESNMTPEQQKQLETKIREKYTGPDGLRVAVSNQKMEFTTMTSTLKEAEWMDGTKLNKQEICEVYRVPTQLLGIENSMTYANYAEANISFFKQAVIPLADLWCSEMNRWLGDFFPGFKVAYNKSDLDALEMDRANFRQQMLTSGAFSINEIREAFGKPARPEPEADTILTDASKLPLGMDVFAEQPAVQQVAKALMGTGLTKEQAEIKAVEFLR